MRFAFRRLSPYYASMQIDVASIAEKIERLMMHSFQTKEVNVCARELFLNLNRFWHEPKKSILMKKYEGKVDFDAIQTSTQNPK